MAQIIRSPSLAAQPRTLGATPAEAQRPRPDTAVQAVSGPDDGQVRRLAAEQERQRADAARQQAERERSEQVRLAAEAEAAERAARERELDEAFSAAREQGYQEGYQAGEQAAHEALSEAQSRLEALGAELAAARARLWEEIEPEAVALVFEAICKVFGATIAASDGVAAQLAQVAAMANGARPLRVRLHPHDVELMRQRPTAGMEIEWVADASLTAGGCIVESQRGSLEARLDQQLADIRSALLAHYRPAAEEPIC
jgi:flagellar assembly protein FliH